MRSAPAIAITAGDPCGIGPEVTLKALARVRAGSRPSFVVIGDHHVFERTATLLRRRLPPWQLIGAGEPWPDTANRLVFLDCGRPGRFTPGRSSLRAGRASLDYVQRAMALWRAGRIQGLVTAPVTKWAIQRAHPRFVGQTEHLAAQTGVKDVVMMFVSDTMRVVVLTRHIPLRRVAQALNRRLVMAALRLSAQCLKTQFHIRSPKLALCGVNPHAGEGARAGTEERTVMIPVMRALRREGIRCEGLFAADGLFASRPKYDAILCPYHDQGLIPFKMAARDRGCQMSVGLPLVRTSPDHGSALDIAGRGLANPGSMVYALDLAIALVQGKTQKEKVKTTIQKSKF